MNEDPLQDYPAIGDLIQQLTGPIRPADRRDVLQAIYPTLGKGSARTVFRLNGEWVLKLARNKKGIHQNRQEALISQQLGQHANLAAILYDWRGKNVLTIGRFEPSSKLHNTCGYINKDLTLSDREWVCPNCGEQVLRDINAAINILHFGLLKDSGRQSSVVPVESPTLVGTMKQEKLASGKPKRALPDT